MKNLTFVVASAIMVSILGYSQSAVIDDPLEQVESYSLIDTIIKGILEKMRPKLANITVNDINKVIQNPNLNATVIIKDASVNNLDTYNIEVLKSSLIPLKLTNLTLTWNNIVASAYYNISANVGIPQIDDSIKLFGEGYAKAILQNLFITTGANVELKNNVIKIKPKGLVNFDVRVEGSNVTVTSLMGSSELGNTVGALISKLLPELVESLKKPLFNVFQDDIIKIINQVLKNGVLFVDEEPLLNSPESFLKNWDLNEIFKQRFDLGMEENEFKFESES